MLHMVKSFKANRDLLKKRKRKTKADVYGSSSNIRKIHLKKSTPEAIKAIREKIALQKRKEKRINILAFILTVVILSGVFLLIFLD